MIIKLLIDGGDMKPGPAIAQQLGPMGINMGKVISDINSSTKDFKGVKVPVELDVNEKTKSFTIKISSPPTSELLKKELKLEKGTSDHKVTIVGNASIEDVIKITKIKSGNMLEKDLKSAVKSVLGTCKSIGILVENKNPKDLVIDVNNGVYDKEIKSESTVTTTEKRKKLDEFYNKIKEDQDNKVKMAQKAAEEEEAKKTEEAKAKIQDKSAATSTKTPAATTTTAAKAPPAAAGKAPAKAGKK
jgi:large subunit ribosomal protein L11